MKTVLGGEQPEKNIQVMFLQTDMFDLYLYMGEALYWHFHKTCHIMSGLGDDDRVTGEKAGKLVTVI